MQIFKVLFLLGVSDLLCHASHLDVVVKIKETLATQVSTLPAANPSDLVAQEHTKDDDECLQPWSQCSGVVGPKCCEPFHCYSDRVHCTTVLCCTNVQVGNAEMMVPPASSNRARQQLLAAELKVETNQPLQGDPSEPPVTMAAELEAQIQLDTKKGPNNVTGTFVKVKADGHTGYASFMDSELSIGLIEVLSQDMAISMQPPAGEMDFVLAVLKDVLVDVPSKSGLIVWTED